MTPWGWSIIALLAGFAGLIWSADRFVEGSAALAHRLGVSKLVIGLTIVAFGTSAPEIMVSLSASVRDAGELAVGNALGSNLANMGLVLAITALLVALPIQPHLLTRELPALLLTTLLAGFTLYDGQLTRLEGLLLVAALVVVLAALALTRRAHPEEVDSDIPECTPVAAALWFLIGLVTLVISAELLVWGARNLALAAGVSPLVVGLTVVAVGTSLPELAASVGSALKGHQDMALGNIIGSNLFNLLAVMALPGLIQEPVMDRLVFHRDYLAMAAMTLALAIAIGVDYRMRRNAHTGPGEARGHLGRLIGTVLLGTYIGYYLWLLNTL
ncbi:calcium/sodium antiporter [Marinimicrobium sp. C6131]|uniref:calcium/sodium antiporter n=1 Tax=Marinimicrobium sp. C6131 TaxID=3022676 RepID=UPI00223E3D4A|nr:calcium/sodium antiporter [Marinimicrobium sp. C6131]UZJ44823.1 calcium/sodium antiporter [Marinimicrobium sp. C6131]